MSAVIRRYRVKQTGAILQCTFRKGHCVKIQRVTESGQILPYAEAGAALFEWHRLKDSLEDVNA